MRHQKHIADLFNAKSNVEFQPVQAAFGGWPYLNENGIFRGSKCVFVLKIEKISV